ncbi:hypothetical protein [Azospirillum sp. SYSU D00513]|nr:hypothetical protein [Azospirillum sp. SYSU D00513]
MEVFKEFTFWIFFFGLLAALAGAFAVVYTTSKKWGEYSPPEGKQHH